MIDISLKNKRRLLRLALSGDKAAAKELQETIEASKPWKTLITDDNLVYYDNFDKTGQAFTRKDLTELGKKFNFFIISCGND